MKCSTVSSLPRKFERTLTQAGPRGVPTHGGVITTKSPDSAATRDDHPLQLLSLGPFPPPPLSASAARRSAFAPEMMHLVGSTTSRRALGPDRKGDGGSGRVSPWRRSAQAAEKDSASASRLPSLRLRSRAPRPRLCRNSRRLRRCSSGRSLHRNDLGVLPSMRPPNSAAAAARYPPQDALIVRAPWPPFAGSLTSLFSSPSLPSPWRSRRSRRWQAARLSKPRHSSRARTYP
mmetsp:Transcript_33111/g.104766  ORF Transcript_33111/g.104766 Transcript_33111/m.104766 type:complete len:233 (-) Transcript_33111:230-928(-)